MRDRDAIHIQKFGLAPEKVAAPSVAEEGDCESTESALFTHPSCSPNFVFVVYIPFLKETILFSCTGSDLPQRLAVLVCLALRGSPALWDFGRSGVNWEELITQDLLLSSKYPRTWEDSSSS